MERFNAVNHVIFDLDGLLLDTEDIYSRIMDIIASDYGKQFTWQLKLKMMGKKRDEAAQEFIDFFKIPMTVDDYNRRLEELYDVHMVNNSLLPGAERLVKHLYHHGVPMAIATGSSLSSYQLKISKHRELFSLFHHVVCSTSDPEVKCGKPAPDCFLVAASRFENRPTPDKVLVFEDAPNGVEAALAANMPVVWVPHPMNPIRTLTDNLQPMLLLQSLTDFKPEMFGLPSFTD